LQPDINEKMRAILIDWLVEVHLKFKVSREPPPSRCSKQACQLQAEARSVIAAVAPGASTGSF
jgi:hypothetical protein